MVDSFSALQTVGAAFWVCNIIFMLDGAAYFGILNILTLFLHKQLQMTDLQAGTYVGVFLTGAVTIFAAVFGFVVDKLGVKRSIFLNILIALVGRSLLAVAPEFKSYTMLPDVTLFGVSLAGPASNVVAAVALLLMAFSAGLLQSALYAGVKQSTDARTSAVGFSLLYALMNGGIVVESLISSPVRARYDTVGVMWLCVAITVIYLVLHLVVFPKDAGARVTVDRKGESWLSAILEMLNPRFVFFIFILLGVRTLFAHQWLTMPAYITRSYPAAVGERFEWINALNPFIILVGTPLVAALTSKVHVVKMMIVGTLVSASATFLLVPGPNVIALLTYVTIFSIGEALWSSRFYEYVANLAPPDRVGVYMGWASIPWFLAKTITGPFSGWMLGIYCPDGGPFRTGEMWLIYGLIGMTSPIGLILASKWLMAPPKGPKAV